MVAAKEILMHTVVEKDGQKVMVPCVPVIKPSGNKLVMSFANVSEMIAHSRITTGDIISLHGFYELGDTEVDAMYTVYVNTDGTFVADASDVLLDTALDSKQVYLRPMNTSVVSYRMFGAKLDGTTDDSVAINKCHTYANLVNAKVVNHRGIIYKKDTAQIVVKTDVDLSGSTIKVTDENTDYRAWYKIGNVSDVYYDYPYASLKNFLRENCAYIEILDNSLPANSVVKLSEDAFNTRNDAGTEYTNARSELMVHDNIGLCTGSLIEDWCNSPTTKCTYTIIPTKTLTFTGCDVDIETSANVYVNVINVTRHNCIIKDFVIRPHRNSLRNNTKFKNAVFFVEDSYNVRMENITGFNTAGRNDGSSILGTSGYMISLRGSMKISVDNCRLQGFWGATAINDSKDIHFTNCEVNRIDTHDYFRDVFVDNCTIYNYGLQIGYGSGMVAVSNTTFQLQHIPDQPCSPQFHILSLDTTYGRVFKGKIGLSNVSVTYGGTTVNDTVDIDILYADFTDGVADKSKSVAPYMMPDMSIRDMKFMAPYGTGDTERKINVRVITFNSKQTVMPLHVFRKVLIDNISIQASSGVYTLINDLTSNAMINNVAAPIGATKGYINIINSEELAVDSGAVNVLGKTDIVNVRNYDKLIV